MNIGDESVLRRLSTEAGIPTAMVERAWQDMRFEERLRQNLRAAAQIGLRGTPTFIIGRQVIAGAVPYAQIQRAARLAAAEG